MSEAFIPETKKPGDMIRPADWNRAMQEIVHLEDAKLDNTGPGTFQGQLGIQGTLEVTGKILMGGVRVGVNEGFDHWTEAEANKPRTAEVDGFVSATLYSGIGTSGTLVGETPVGQPRRTASLPPYPTTNYLSDQTPRLAGDNPAHNDFFGASIAISGDTLVIGAPQKDVYGADVGQVYVFERQDGSWVKKATLIHDDYQPGDRFGAAVAISKSGDTILIGAPGKGGFDIINTGGVPTPRHKEIGAGYIFVKKDGVWVQHKTLRRPLEEEGRWAYSHIGFAVSIADDIALLGAPDSNVVIGTNMGASLAYIRKGDDWVALPHFPNAGYNAGGIDNIINKHGYRGNEKVGASIAGQGDMFFVGAPSWSWGNHNQHIGGGVGIVQVFVRKGDRWEQQGSLISNYTRNNFNIQNYGGSYFGQSLAIDGTTLLVGEPRNEGNTLPGSVYIFTLKGGSWVEKARITAKDATQGDLFGASVAVSGNYALIGAPGKNSIGSKTGAVYLFELKGENWVEVNKWIPGDGGDNDAFGTSVALDGKNSTMSSVQAKNVDAIRGGAVYVTNTQPAPRPASFLMPVRKGDSWSVQLTNDWGTCSAKVDWLPMGAIQSQSG